MEKIIQRITLAISILSLVVSVTILIVGYKLYKNIYKGSVPYSQTSLEKKEVPLPDGLKEENVNISNISYVGFIGFVSPGSLKGENGIKSFELVGHKSSGNFPALENIDDSSKDHINVKINDKTVINKIVRAIKPEDQKVTSLKYQDFNIDELQGQKMKNIYVVRYDLADGQSLKADSVASALTVYVPMIAKK